MAVNGNQKGKRGERELSALLRKHGFEARRGQQYSGTADSPDIVHNMTGFYIECKLRQQLNLYDAIKKANSEKREEDVSLVFHRKNNKPWLVTMDAEEFLRIAAEELFE